MFCRMRKEKEEERFRIELEFNQKLLQEAEANTTTLSNTSKHTVLICSHLTCYTSLFTLLKFSCAIFFSLKNRNTRGRSAEWIGFDVRRCECVFSRRSSGLRHVFSTHCDDTREGCLGQTVGPIQVGLLLFVKINSVMRCLRNHHYMGREVPSW